MTEGGGWREECEGRWGLLERGGVREPPCKARGGVGEGEGE